MNKDTIAEFFNALSYPAARAVEAYTNWTFTSSIVWLIAGIIMMCSYFYLPDWRDDNDARVGLFVKGFLMSLGFLFIAVNIPDILQPEAKGIHYLLKDIRG